jgi:predicted phage terminase large subunit-like protein
MFRGEWSEKFLDEITAFPDGSHDDQVDAASGAFNDFVRGNGCGLLI